MTIHFVFLFTIFILVYIYRKRKEKKRSSKVNNIFFIFIATVLILFVGLRKMTVGTDTPTYVTMFETGQWSVDNIEIALPLIGKLIHLFTDKYFIFLSILSAISLLGILNVLKERDFDIELFIYLYIASYCYLYSTTAIRFFCAFSIILLSFKYMIEKKTLKVLSLILLATLFHTSAIIFVPLYFITRFKYSRKNILVFFVIVAILSVVIELMSTYIFHIDVFQKYSYIEEEVSINFGPSIIINLVTLFLAIAFYDKIEKYTDEYEFCTKMLVVGFFVDMLSIAYRAVWYFRFPVWFVIPIILTNIKHKDRKTYIAIYILAMILYGVYYYYVLKNSLPSNNFLNYKFNMELN